MPFEHFTHQCNALGCRHHPAAEPFRGAEPPCSGVVPSGRAGASPARTATTPSARRRRRRAVDGDGERASVVLVDHDITPSQARNLERATGAEVLDRTAVILAIFQRHARSREARLQVEIARLAYMAPRLRESGGGKDRQGGGIGGKGAGESQLELDRRKVRDRIAELRRELAAIEKDAATRRRRRADAADGGHRRLHQRRQVVADARPDRQRRCWSPTSSSPPSTPPCAPCSRRPSRASWSATRSASSRSCRTIWSPRSAPRSTRRARRRCCCTSSTPPTPPSRRRSRSPQQVLAEIDAADVPRLLVLNKIDQLDEARRAALAQAYPEAVLLSAKSAADVAALRERIVEFFERDMVEAAAAPRRARLASL